MPATARPRNTSRLISRLDAGFATAGVEISVVAAEVVEDINAHEYSSAAIRAPDYLRDLFILAPSPSTD
jgi:hypothetical protein